MSAVVLARVSLMRERIERKHTVPAAKPVGLCAVALATEMSKAVAALGGVVAARVVGGDRPDDRRELSGIPGFCASKKLDRH